MKTIYIAAPYTQGDTAWNVRRAIDLEEYLFNKGYHVFNPLLTHFVHMIHARPYEFWLKEDLYWLEKCDAIVRIQGPSNGADREVVAATHLGMPVGEFTGFSAAGLNALDDWLSKL